MALKRSLGSNGWVAPVTIFGHAVAVAIAVMVLVWVLHFREGLAFRTKLKPKIFNIHPLLMVVGFILVSGEAIMVYKTVRSAKKNRKLIHMIAQLIALTAGIIGIYAVFKFHRESGIPDMYTLHSWLGMSTICLFALQWMFSFWCFWYPGAGSSTRSRVAPWHAVFGTIIFFTAILTAMTGLVEKFIFLGLHRSEEAMIVNFTGLLLLLFAVAVGLTIALPETTY